MSARELAERIEALAARMTQGEWNADPDPRPGMEWNWHIYRGSADRIAFMANSPRSKHDAALIVTLVNAVPEITADLRRVEALEAALRRIDDADYINQLQGTVNFERLQSIARAALKGGDHD